MVETQLTPELIREGAILVEALDKAGVSPDAALWLYSPEVATWKLLLAQTKVKTDGPREVYRTIQKTLNALRNQIAHVRLEDVAVTAPDVPIIKLLAQAIIFGPGISGIRLKQNVLDGMLIEDAYIYRLKRPAA